MMHTNSPGCIGSMHRCPLCEYLELSRFGSPTSDSVSQQPPESRSPKLELGWACCPSPHTDV